MLSTFFGLFQAEVIDLVAKVGTVYAYHGYIFKKHSIY